MASRQKATAVMLLVGRPVIDDVTLTGLPICCGVFGHALCRKGSFIVEISSQFQQHVTKTRKFGAAQRPEEFGFDRVDRRITGSQHLSPRPRQRCPKNPTVVRSFTPRNEASLFEAADESVYRLRGHAESPR